MVMGIPAFAAVPVNFAVKVDQSPASGTVPVAIIILVLPTSKSAVPAKLQDALGAIGAKPELIVLNVPVKF